MAAALQARIILAVAVLVIAGLIVAGALAVWPGLISLAVVLAGGVAVLVLHKTNVAGPEPPPSSYALAPGDPLLSAAVAGIPDAVVVLNRDGRVLAHNAPMEALAPALRPGEPASIALRTPELVEAIREACASGELRQVEFSLRVPGERWYEAFVTPVTRDSGGTAPLSLVLVTLRDLTPLRQVEEMRADFVANASHELRTPLAALSGFIETLQGPAREDVAAQRRFLPIMHAQAARMARVIDDLLSLSRIERNEHRQPDTVVELAPLVRQVVDGLESLARERGVAIAIKASPEPVRVLGDRDELIRAFENLVENALKYGANGKRVDIAIGAVQAVDGTADAVVAVQDYGPGIAPEHLPRLTERFYRVDVADSRAQGGTGLGLALVKHILNRHRGRLSIVSTRGAGATFTAHIPRFLGNSGPAENPRARS
jgi:two-component system phosphate regulon sensor histidine kinase PhoR